MNRKIYPILLALSLVVIGFLLLLGDPLVSMANIAYKLLRGGLPNAEIIRRLGFNCIWYGALAVIVLFCLGSKKQYTVSNRRTDNIVVIMTSIIAVSYTHLTLPTN